MSKHKFSRKCSNHSRNFFDAIPVQKPFGVYLSERPIVSDSIQKNPSNWAELPLPENDNGFVAIEGADVEFPILGDEYRVDFWHNEIGEFCFLHFLAHLQALSSCRLFVCQDKQAVYVCTEVDAETMAIVINSAFQDFMHEFGCGKIL